MKTQSKPKHTKAQCNYRMGTGVKHCGICTHYRDGKCTLVQGSIAPQMLCNYFYPARMATTALSRVDLTAETPVVSTVHHPFGSPAGPGLWGVKGMQLPAYIQNVAHALLRNGRAAGESRAIQMAVGIVKNWAHGHDGHGHKVSADVQAAAAKAIAEWDAERARAKADNGRNRRSRNARSTQMSSIAKPPRPLGLKPRFDMWGNRIRPQAIQLSQPQPQLRMVNLANMVKHTHQRASHTMPAQMLLAHLQSHHGVTPTTQGQSVLASLHDGMHKSTKPGGGGRFAALAARLQSQGKSPEDAAKIAAAIGRAKYGAGKFTAMAAKGGRKAAVPLGR
jgi:hypothetical protein